MWPATRRASRRRSIADVDATRAGPQQRLVTCRASEPRGGPPNAADKQIDAWQAGNGGGESKNLDVGVRGIVSAECRSSARRVKPVCSSCQGRRRANEEWNGRPLGNDLSGSSPPRVRRGVGERMRCCRCRSWVRVEAHNGRRCPVNSRRTALLAQKMPFGSAARRAAQVAAGRTGPPPFTSSQGVAERHMITLWRVTHAPRDVVKQTIPAACGPVHSSGWLSGTFGPRRRRYNSNQLTDGGNSGLPRNSTAARYATAVDTRVLAGMAIPFPSLPSVNTNITSWSQPAGVISVGWKPA